MDKGKTEITISSQVDTLKKAKELLADLEVLNEKYDIVATVNVYQKPNIGVLSYGKSVEEIKLDAARVSKAIL